MTEPETTVAVFVSRIFDAKPEIVFDAWLNPNSVGKWLFKTPDGTMTKVEIDATVGGSFTIIEERGDHDAEHHGTYLEIDRPNRLKFSFGGPGFPDTQVTIDIKPAEGGCELTLTHEGVLGEFKNRTEQGWSGILEGLAVSLK